MPLVQDWMTMLLITGCTYLSETELVKVTSPCSKFATTFLGKLLLTLVRNTILATPFYSKTLKNIKDDVIIVSDEIATKPFLSFLSKYNPDKRKIFWYWQSCSQTYPVAMIPKEYEVWTYSRHDADSLHLMFNPTFLPNNIAFGMHDSVSDACQYDFSFIGKNKGRASSINALVQRLRLLGYSVNLRFVKKGRFQIFHKKNEQSRLSYADYLRFHASAKCVIDYCVSPEAGLSLRPLEASCLNRKVITNCLEAKDYPEICGDTNLMIIDKEIDEGTLSSFMKTPPSYDIEAVKNKYSLDAWAKRFTNV